MLLSVASGLKKKLRKSEVIISEQIEKRGRGVSLGSFFIFFHCESERMRGYCHTYDYA
jgi:hypothetical protein